MQNQQHQLTRQRQLGIARQRLANQQVPQVQTQTRMTVPQGQNGVDVAGCAPEWNQGGFVSPGDPWNSAQGFIGLPNLSPKPTPGMLVINLYRLGVIVQAAAGGVARTISVAPESGASLFVEGFLSRNNPAEIIIHSIEQGSVAVSSVSEIDASVFNCDVCYCPADVGCANNLSPLVISFSAFGAPSVLPYLNLCAVGTWQAGWGTCGVPYGNGFQSPVPTMPGSYYGGGYGGFPGGYAGPPAGPVG